MSNITEIFSRLEPEVMAIAGLYEFDGPTIAAMSVAISLKRIADQSKRAEQPARTFTVGGKGEFPLDALSYGECWPATAGDAWAILASLRGPEGPDTPPWRIDLKSNGLVSPGGWQRRGWRVL